MSVICIGIPLWTLTSWKLSFISLIIQTYALVKLNESKIGLVYYVFVIFQLLVPETTVISNQNFWAQLFKTNNVVS